MAKMHSVRDSVRVAVRCKRDGCTAWLINPESVRVGMGPVCRAHARAERDLRRRDEDWGLFPAPAQVITLKPGKKRKRPGEAA